MITRLGLTRSRGLVASAPDWKPEPRIIDPEAGIAKVLAEGRCRLCGARGGLGRHHLVARSQGGSDVDDNLVPLCIVCHEDVERQRHEARRRLRLVLRPEEWDYVVGRVGLGRAQARYP